MNKNKRIEQLKKVDAIDHQLTTTINKIAQINQPLKVNKKQLSIFVLITFGIASFLTAIITFLTIDPFRWYTINYDTYLVRRKDKIVKKFESFSMPNEFVLDEKAKKLANLLESIKHSPDLETVFESINEKFNYDTVINIYDANNLLQDNDNLTTKVYQMKFNFTDYDINIAITINVNVRISPF